MILVSFYIFVFFSQFKEIFTFILSIVFIMLYSFFSEGSPNPTNIGSSDPSLSCSPYGLWTVSIVCRHDGDLDFSPKAATLYSPCPDPVYLLGQCSVSKYISAHLPHFWIPGAPDPSNIHGTPLACRDTYDVGSREHATVSFLSDQMLYVNVSTLWCGCPREHGVAVCEVISTQPFLLWNF